MQLHFRVTPQPGYTPILGPHNSPLKLLTFGLLRLNPQETYQAETGDQEAALVILSGTCTVRCSDREWPHLGQRSHVFDGRATTVYLPRGSAFSVSGETAVEIALCQAPAHGDAEPAVIRPEQVKARTVGMRNWQRRVENSLDERIPATRLVVGETFNPPGNWSSYPPHKHDVDALPQEVDMEEVYYFRLQPPQGFGLQRIYLPERDLDVAYPILDGDVVALPFGYHPVVAAPGYSLYYLWCLAGRTTRLLQPHEDPAHAWIKQAEVLLREGNNCK
ncbi:MAG TPA: 5-deoxy-glucuronate isomerase [Armatimonadetes bacterium]|nr:5-deoxy-glucuronate isomerase [Armatimonadota bacterium]